MEYSARQYLVGVNGGHHKSTALLYDPSAGKPGEPVYGKLLNPHALDDDELLTRCCDLLDDMARSSGFDSFEEMRTKIRRIVVSLPGVGLEHDQDRARRVIGEAINKEVLQVVDDTWAGLFSETREARGICAFAGAGASVCIAFGRFETGKANKIDGWGPVIGDFGSAFQLVTDFLRGLGRTLDKGSSSSLFQKVKEYTAKPEANIFELKDMEHVQQWFDTLNAELESEWRTMYSRLAIPITAAADREPVPDLQARKLVKMCAAHLARSIDLACERFGSKAERLPIVLQGGMCRSSRYYRESVVEALGSRSSRVRLARRKPVVGALMMACGDSTDLVDNVIDGSQGVPALCSEL